MKTFFVKAVVVAAAFFLTTFAVQAHHSVYGNFDIKRLVEVKGKFVGADIINPHAWFHFEEVDEKGVVKLGADGKPIVWAFETPGPAMLRRLGITPSLFKKGDIYTVYAPPALDGSPKGLFALTLFPDGRRLFLGSRDDPNMKPILHLLEQVEKKQ